MNLKKFLILMSVKPILETRKRIYLYELVFDKLTHLDEHFVDKRLKDSGRVDIDWKLIVKLMYDTMV